MMPSDEIARFLAEAPTGQDVTLLVPGGEATFTAVFPDEVTIPCTRCGVATCWQRGLCPPGPVRTFGRLLYHCQTCEGNAGFYLLVRWVADRGALILRKVAQFLPPGQGAGPRP